MLVIDHDGHTIEERDGKPVRCLTCDVALEREHGVRLAVHPTADGDGSHGVDVSLHLEIDR